MLALKAIRGRSKNTKHPDNHTTITAAVSTYLLTPACFIGIGRKCPQWSADLGLVCFALKLLVIGCLVQRSTPAI